MSYDVFLFRTTTVNVNCCVFVFKPRTVDSLVLSKMVRFLGVTTHMVVT